MDHVYGSRVLLLHRSECVQISCMLREATFFFSIFQALIFLRSYTRTNARIERPESFITRHVLTLGRPTPSSKDFSFLALGARLRCVMHRGIQCYFLIRCLLILSSSSFWDFFINLPFSLSILFAVSNPECHLLYFVFVPLFLNPHFIVTSRRCVIP